MAAGTVAIAAIALLAGCKKDTSSDNQVLNIYIWSEYLPDSVVHKFTDKTGIKVNVATYGKNEEIQEKLRSGVADYDIVVPSDYMVTILASEKLIQPIDRSHLTHFDTLDPNLLDQPYDPKNVHSVPYLWGLTGLGYDKTKVSGAVDSWQVLFDPTHSGQISMLDDQRECFGVALKLMGKSLNETDSKLLDQAAAMLKKQKPLVRAYDSEDFAAKLTSGDAVYVHGYTGQLAKAAHNDPDKRFVVMMPKEGGTIAVDNLCIPASSKRADVAHKFIDFCLEPDIAAEIANSTFYASANRAARAKIKPELLNDPAIYPTTEMLKRCEFIRDVGDQVRLYQEKLWTEIKGE
jgi:spermidine/putrescine transport system substrate-binding protein